MNSANQPVKDNGGAGQPSTLERGPKDVRGRPTIAINLPPSDGQEVDQESGQLFPRGTAYATRVDLSAEHAIKRLFDIVGALVLAVLFSPVIMLVLVGAAVNGQSPFFRQQRVGRDGKLFDCLKFRTMVPDAEEVLHQLLSGDPELHAEWQRHQKLRDDPRVTPIGGFLRASSLDELPQLWNVLKGEMSLVGPRPIMRDQQLMYGRNLVIYTLTRPGMTGLWQVSGRNLLDFRKRVAMDIVYVRKQSLVLDIWILLKTIFVVVTRHGAY